VGGVASEIKTRIRTLTGKSALRRMQAGFWKVCSEMSNAELVGYARRQLAILGRRDWDANDLRDIVRDYVIEHLADVVIDETGFQTGQGVVRSAQFGDSGRPSFPHRRVLRGIAHRLFERSHAT
jgi:hypothetical protein